MGPFYLALINPAEGLYGRILTEVSLRASSPIWASETSLARTREEQRKGELATIPYKFSFVLRPDEGKYHWLKNDVPEIKID